MPIRLLLADDHKIVRDGLRALLEREDDLEVVGEAENGHDAVRLARKLDPDVVVMDIAMPDLNGVGATRQVQRRHPACRVIGLSVHTDPRFVCQMLEAGAAGYVLKKCAFEELVQGVRAVASGHTYLSPCIARTVQETRVQSPPDGLKPTGSELSPREREVLQLLAEGHGTKQIARRLHVSSKTVDTHRQHVMKKLDIHDVPGLTKYAVRHGLTSLEN